MIFLFIKKYQVLSNGHNKEIIMMTPNTFKELCILANTEKGKQVRRYYIKMESIVNKYLKNKNEQLVKEYKTKNEQQSKEHQDTINQLQNEMITLQKLVKPKKIYELGETVYIVKQNDEYKVGSSINMNTRNFSYGSHNRDYEILYTKRCNNEKL